MQEARNFFTVSPGYFTQVIDKSICMWLFLHIALSLLGGGQYIFTIKQIQVIGLSGV